MRTILDYTIEVLLDAPNVMGMDHFDEEWFDNLSDIETVRDDENVFHFETREKADTELKRLKEIQKNPGIKFRIIENIINVGDWI
ncbi:MAG: hypothetical protein PHT07_14935 [Paludibacter sp.]|nr:hypothetical protein [Paludibacter sp.]